MSDYAAIVDRRELHAPIIPVRREAVLVDQQRRRNCFVSVSGNDRISAISNASGREVARIAVGDHPQRMRMGRIRRAFVR